MTTTWSRLHAALGLEPQPISWEVLEMVCREQVGEEADLDFKEALPSREERALDEFAKDVAAMANSGGGVLVYGLREDGQGRAQRITPVDVGEAARQRLRAVAYSRIRPLVAGVTVEPIRRGPTNDQGVLALVVPPSPDVPHVVGRDNRVGVPFRDGAETRWMQESQIERAYLDRFEWRRREEERLSSLVSDLIDLLDVGASAWVVVAVAPPSLRPRIASPPSADETRQCLEEALRLAAEAQPGPRSESFLRDLGSGARNPQLGLRRWIVEAPRSGPGDVAEQAIAALQHDGSCIFAFALEGWYHGPSDGHGTPVAAIDQAVADGVVLGAVHARRVGLEGLLAARVDLIKGDDRPFAAVDSFPRGYQVSNPEPPRQSRLVRRFSPVSGPVPVTTDLDVLRSSAAGIASDVLNQFGLASRLGRG